MDGAWSTIADAVLRAGLGEIRGDEARGLILAAARASGIDADLRVARALECVAVLEAGSARGEHFHRARNALAGVLANVGYALEVVAAMPPDTIERDVVLALRHALEASQTLATILKSER